MSSFTPKTFESIIDDMIAYVSMQSNITDFEEGSVIRTILEAAALEDDEQYFQIVQLLDAFNLSNSTGQDTIDRLAEYNIIPLNVASSTGYITVKDSLLKYSEIAINIAAGVTSIQINDSSKLPTSGFPYTVRIGEGQVNVEEVTVTANNTGTNTLTTSATANAHYVNELVSYVSGGSDRKISPGIRVQVPATDTENEIVYVTVESGVLANGNYESTKILARAEVAGANGNITGNDKINEFVSDPPFSGALVTNKTNFSGGRDLETNKQLKDRGKASIQSLSAGIVLALKSGVVGIADPVTGQRVTTSNVKEFFTKNEVVVYVDDGTGFTPDTVQMAQTALLSSTLVGVSSLTVVDSKDFTEEGFLIISTEDSSQIELLEYSNVNYVTNTITLVGLTSKAHDAGDEIILVDIIENNAEASQNFFQCHNFPIVRDSQRIWVDSGSGPKLQQKDVDYFFNRGVGEIEMFGSGVPLNAKIVGHYKYYTSLISHVQKVVNGAIDAPALYPGIRSGGIHVVIETPIVRRITLSLSITAQVGYQEVNLYDTVREIIESYINGLGIGENVILAEVIERAMSIDGMYNVIVQSPNDDIVVSENEISLPYDADGNSLINVT